MFVASSVTVHAMFLKKRSKMSQPIRVHGGHLGFPITTKSNNTSAGLLEEHLWQVWCQYMQWFLRRSKKCLGHLGFPITLKSNKTNAGPLEEHLWQVWCQCMQWFFRRSQKCLEQSESMVAILDFCSH